MFIARIVCSDWECAEEREVTIESLDELDELTCECSHGFALISVSELRDSDRGQLVELPRRRATGNRRAA